MAYKKYSLRFKKELYYIFLIVVVGGILLLGFLGPDGYLALKNEQQKVLQQQQNINELEFSNRELKQSIDDMRSDPEALENYAREKGYGRDNEIIQQLSDDPPENPED